MGGGSGELRLPDLEPIPVKFTELSGGASLWRDFAFGRATFSLGGRVAFTWLARRFPKEEELPNQYFFTVTPGLTGAAAWRFTPSLSAVGRVRLNYLFYNVDENRSLGFVEGFLGVEYALGE
jgi:hypothetical protein